MQQVITKDLVKFLASLGKITLTDEQIDKYTNDLNQIVNYVAKVGKMPTKGIKPKFHTTPNKNIFDTRKTGQNTLTSKQALFNAKNIKDNMFVIPRIIIK